MLAEGTWKMSKPLDFETQASYYDDLWAKESYANAWQLERCIAILEHTLASKNLTWALALRDMTS